MKVIKSAGVNGSLPSFTPVLSDQADAQNEAFEEELVEKVPAMTEQEKKERLKIEFATELEELKQQARAEGYAEGKVEAEKTFGADFDAQLEELKETIQSWVEMINKAEANASWEITQDEDLLNLLYQATTKLLRKELSDKQYAANLVAELVDEYAEKRIKILTISELHHEHLSQLNLLKAFSEKFEVIGEKDISPGSFKLSLKNGFIEYDLDVATEQLRQGLLDTLEQVKEGI